MLTTASQSSTNPLIFFGNLPEDITDHLIHQFITKFGNVEKMMIVKSSLTNNCLGYCLAKFAPEGNSKLKESSFSACKNLQFWNHQITVKIIKSENDLKNAVFEFSEKRILITGFTEKLKNIQILNWFKNYGEIENFCRKRDQKTGNLNSFGYICYKSEKGAFSCLNSRDEFLSEKTVKYQTMRSKFFNSIQSFENHFNFLSEDDEELSSKAKTNPGQQLEKMNEPYSYGKIELKFEEINNSNNFNKKARKLKKGFSMSDSTRRSDEKNSQKLPYKSFKKINGTPIGNFENFDKMKDNRFICSPKANFLKLDVVNVKKLRIDSFKQCMKFHARKPTHKKYSKVSKVRFNYFRRKKAGENYRFNIDKKRIKTTKIEEKLGYQNSMRNFRSQKFLENSDHQYSREKINGNSNTTQKIGYPNSQGVYDLNSFRATQRNYPISYGF